MSEKLAVNGYAAAVLQLYKDKEIEINTGETQTTLHFSDWTTELKHVIRGIVKDVIGDALIIECKTRFGKREILVNAWAITSIVPIKHGSSVRDCYEDEQIGKKIKQT